MSKLQLKKLAVAVAALGAVSMGSGVAEAANTSGTFNVNITLTSSCTLAAVTPVAFAYVSLQGGVSNATGGGFNVQCTSTLPYTFGLQTGSGPATPPGTSTINVTDNGVNLAYQLNLSAAGSTGTGLSQSFNVGGTMAANQAGNCALASCTNTAGATVSTNNVQTLIVNY
ncbi:MAG TPA: spore coat protein U domain-containing protein [Burkholderiales bacterium]|jgi:spore coat protein U-like protein|nr:spore coat protein U domain-containing protein [Burkholderiales bacterium]